MRVPQPTLFGWQGCKDPRRDHVLDPEEAGIGLRRVVDETLPYIWVYVAGASLVLWLRRQFYMATK